MKTVFMIIAAVAVQAVALAQPEKAVDREMIPLWQGAAPGAVGSGEGHTPSITPYLPPKDKATGAAIVVCPGGGYGGLALDHEGDQIGRWLNSEGITAFILRYRHAPDYHHPIPLGDAKRAMRTVREQAAKWGIDPNRIGMLGFSAGGHLTATAGTQFDAGDAKAEDPIERVSSRPDFLVLIYPVITFTEPYGHIGSRNNLIGASPDPAMIDALSAEKQVTNDTPPTFLISSGGDTVVPSENSVLFYLALRAHHVPAEMHIFQEGEHGYGLAKDDPSRSLWPTMCINWLRVNKFIK
jgi:acetyl esterase/lipase